MFYYLVTCDEAEDTTWSNRREAMEFARGWAQLGYKHVTLRKVVAYCDTCQDPLLADASCPGCDYQPEEGPSCGVCDGLGHTTDNCTAGDIRGHCPEWAM